MVAAFTSPAEANLRISPLASFSPAARAGPISGGWIITSAAHGLFPDVQLSRLGGA